MASARTRSGRKREQFRMGCMDYDDALTLPIGSKVWYGVRAESENHGGSGLTMHGFWVWPGVVEGLIGHEDPGIRIHDVKIVSQSQDVELGSAFDITSCCMEMGVHILQKRL